MKFYRVTCDNGIVPEDTKQRRNAQYFKTLKAAHEAAKAFHVLVRDAALIDEIEVETTAEAMLELLNGARQPDRFSSLRTWGLTKRGGLENEK